MCIEAFNDLMAMDSVSTMKKDNRTNPYKNSKNPELQKDFKLASRLRNN